MHIFIITHNKKNESSSKKKKKKLDSKINEPNLSTCASIFFFRLFVVIDWRENTPHEVESWPLRKTSYIPLLSFPRIPLPANSPPIPTYPYLVLRSSWRESGRNRELLRNFPKLRNPCRLMATGPLPVGHMGGGTCEYVAGRGGEGERTGGVGMMVRRDGPRRWSRGRPTIN